MRKIATFCLSLLFLSNINFSSAQENNIFSGYEDSLKVLGKNILHGKSDIDKYAANEIFINLLEEALCNNNSYEYPFDSLITIARLVSPDNAFRIFNWNIPRADGTYEYFGLIQKSLPQFSLYFFLFFHSKSSTLQNTNTTMKYNSDNNVSTVRSL